MKLPYAQDQLILELLKAKPDTVVAYGSRFSGGDGGVAFKSQSPGLELVRRYGGRQSPGRSPFR